MADIVYQTVKRAHVGGYNSEKIGNIIWAGGLTLFSGFVISKVKFSNPKFAIILIIGSVGGMALGDDKPVYSAGNSHIIPDYHAKKRSDLKKKFTSEKNISLIEAHIKVSALSDSEVKAQLSPKVKTQYWTFHHHLNGKDMLLSFEAIGKKQPDILAIHSQGKDYIFVNHLGSKNQTKDIIHYNLNDNKLSRFGYKTDLNSVNICSSKWVQLEKDLKSLATILPKIQ